jgi:hypothetical protein
LKAQRSSSASIPSSSTTFSPSFPSAHNAALGKFFSTPDTGTLQYQLEILYLRFPSSGCFSLKPSHDCMHLVQISVQMQAPQRVLSRTGPTLQVLPVMLPVLFFFIALFCNLIYLLM